MKKDKILDKEIQILSKQKQPKKADNLILIQGLEKLENSNNSLIENLIKFINKESKEVQKVDGKMKIINFPEVQKIIGSLIVKNFPGIQKIIGSVKIDNFPKKQQVKGKVEVTNLQDIDDKEIINKLIRLEEVITNLDFPEPLKEIIIKNFPEVITKLEISKLPEEVIDNIISKIENNTFDIKKIAQYFEKNPDKFLNVRLTDGKHWYKALSEMVTAIGSAGKKPKTPEIHIVDLADKDLEYDFTIPNGTGKALIKIRNYGYDLRLAYAEGETTTRYITIPAGSAGKELVGVYLYQLKIYLRAPDIDAQEVEIELWRY